MKTILGLDLGTNSIGWALVNEAESGDEKSSIIRLGVRVNPLTVDEQQNFEKGKSITTNADRTLKRSMRRNLQRYKLRRENLLEILKEHRFISDETILSENGNRTTFETYRLRAKAATEEISLDQFARVLMMINKKRGYKSSRKAKGTEEGALIDGMDVAKKLYDEKLTPGQLCLQLLQIGKKFFPDFYRSDLQAEFDKIWTTQREFYPDTLTGALKENLNGKNKVQTWAICAKPFGIAGIKRTAKREELIKENFEWRSQALLTKMDLERLAIVLQEVNGQITNSSGYLGKISDRSKELYFGKQTIGQYQMAILDKNPNASLRNMVFYRQDYLDEFNALWETQAKFHKELIDALKHEIRDVIIFYQRQLKSQKGLIGFCEFESRKKEVEIEGKKKMKTIGSRVIPRSSPLFQEFKIWQTLNNLEISGKGRRAKKRKEPFLFTEQEDLLEMYGKRGLFQEEKEILAKELAVKKKLTKHEILKILFDNPQELDLNFKEIQGNITQAELFQAYQKIIELSGHELDSKKTTGEILKNVENIFRGLGYNTEILYFDSGKPLNELPMYRLWHLLYSFEGDDSATGNQKLINKIIELCGFGKEFATILADISFPADYGNLSAKAIRKILPHLKEGNKYDVACVYAGYRHSKSSLNKEEIENKVYRERLEILPKNSLRNPVVEKILNQMVNVVNALIDTHGKPDEIRIELARELKKNAEERRELTKSIAETTKLHTEYKKILSQPPFRLNYISRNDIIRYKLYEELKDNGYKTLYSGTYISPAALFNGDFDIEHIIPQSRLFDDSFSNKTLELRSINLEKGNKTARDFVEDKYGIEELGEYLSRIERIFKEKKNKLRKLGMKGEDIPDGFINRDIRDTQYIARYAKTILGELVKRVVSTTGLITDALRKDWQLVDVLKELNWDKYDALGLTYYEENREGKQLRRIKDWTKRNDHRHHAMDALTVAFTKDALIQLFNNMNAASVPNANGFALKSLYIENGKVKPPMPLNEFRAEAKRHLERILVSIKAKNKVVTQNINISRKAMRMEKKMQLTPRGQLHNETIYGSLKQYVAKEEKVGVTFDTEKIGMVSRPAYREALLKRLHENGNDPRKAFGGKNAPSKNPVLLNEGQQVPEKVKTVALETIYTVRKEIGPDLKIEKVIDTGIRRILEKRLADYNNEEKKAFSNLDENPIWLNKEKGISIKRVTISGISNAESLHEKRDKDGKFLLDENGNRQPVDFVSTSSNHHVAVYRDSEGNLQDNVVSFFEAVVRRNAILSVIDREYRQSEGWQFLFSMKQNEYFVFPNEKTGFNPQEVNLLDPGNYNLISPNLYRVQKFSKLFYGNSAVREYVFRHHLETAVKDTKELKDIAYKNIKSLPIFDKIVKVRLNHIGQIVTVGEY